MHDAPSPRGLTRRALIGGALAVPAAAWLAGCGHDDGSTAQLGSWSEVRAEFDLDPGISHLSAYILAPHSRTVRAAIARHRDGMDRAPQQYFHDTQWRAEPAVARAAADHLGVDADLIAFTDSTTMGLGVLLGGIRLERGDEIVTTVHEHFVADQAARGAAARTGARVREITLYPPDAPEQATTGGILTALRQAITSRTRIVLLTWVHSATGIKLPVSEIADLLAEVNAGRRDEQRALLLLDAVHGFGAGPSDLGQLGCDGFATGCHKWLMGPRGTGLVWARPRLWERVAPTIPTFDARLFRPWTEGRTATAPPSATHTPGGYHSFEHRWALAEAFDLHARIGADRIAARVDQLAGRLCDGLAELPAVRVHAPADPRLRSGVITFTVKDLSPEQTVERLYDRHRVSATVTPYAVPLARLGTCWNNTEEEVDIAIEAVGTL